MTSSFYVISTQLNLSCMDSMARYDKAVLIVSCASIMLRQQAGRHEKKEDWSTNIMCNQLPEVYKEKCIELRNMVTGKHACIPFLRKVV